MQRSLGKFLALVLVLSLPFWVLGELTAGTESVSLTSLPLSALMFVCPGIAATLLAWRGKGAAGVRFLFDGLADFSRIPSRHWFVPALLLMPSILALSYVIMRATDMPLPKSVTIDPSSIPALVIAFLFSSINRFSA